MTNYYRVTETKCFSEIRKKYIFAHMINLTKDQIKEIAEQLDCGMRCYINKETGEIKTTPDFDNWYTDDRTMDRCLK